MSEEDRTTLESGWEDDASTTVEQGEVADKLRALGTDPPRGPITHVTSTNGGILDEPTIDDQHANAAIVMIAPPAVVARMVVTSGNDTGQELEISPGKSYTIGRGIDNDIVLTDIAVSRKHFDLRHEGGSWILADRGSGNGTVINGSIEDQPFVLATGDLIEIGNTTFRFEQPNGVARPSFAATPAYIEPAQTYDLDGDEEPSTVAGKAMREDIATPAKMAPPPRMRPMTVPPPAPLPRPRTASQAPPNGYGLG
ncbi:MAG: FHA domain-containing protein, partial [Myxococcota bacterium]|nr:FHA domain-containing protein [Myxococcota bacterium]